MTLADFLEVKADETDIDLFWEKNYIGHYPEGKIYDEIYLESEVLNFYSNYDSLMKVDIEKPRKLVNLGHEENWDNLLGVPVFLRDGSLCKIIREEITGVCYLLNMSTDKMWYLESLVSDPDYEGVLDFFTKKDDPYFVGVEVR